MYCKVKYAALAALILQIVGASELMCPTDPNCVCGGTPAVELNCDINGRIVKINLLPNTYINIQCENVTSLDYSKLPKCANDMSTFKSISFKDCPLPSSSFKDVLNSLGVSKTLALIFQNAKNLSGYFDRKHFAGLQDLTKLLLSINGVTQLPDNLFMDINKLTWLNIKSNTINLSEELFKPLERLETLEISHNHMTNISSNLFSHLTFLRKLSLWQSNVTWFSKDLFTGVDVLEELDLSSNGLNELPASIFKPLRKLKKLTLYSNKFSSLPQNLFKNNEELEIVVILNNDVKLKALPKQLFGNLPNLKEIYIQKSGIENVPYDVFANSSQITNMSLAFNDITTLPESVFNDLINLLELDISNNKLIELKPKLFSSLVRLESLQLCHNMLTIVSGDTFSPLLSLIYLGMENNNLKKISSYLFSNNKQRMYISLAYNKLNFEEKKMINNSWEVVRTSPFEHTYNLKLLNLSHNEFNVALYDWWLNGHEMIDINYNKIEYLWVDGNKPGIFRKLIKKPITVWLAENPLKCECVNYMLIEHIRSIPWTNVVDGNYIRCPLWLKQSCYARYPFVLTFITFIVLVYVGAIIFLFTNRRRIMYAVKEVFCTLLNCFKRRKEGKVVVEYCDPDEEFVFRQIVPVLQANKNLSINLNAIETIVYSKNKFVNFNSHMDDDRYITLVVFSSNYLASHYRHVDIKKIHSQMLKEENTIFVFVDVGPENSIHAFLKEHRDGTNSMLWHEFNDSINNYEEFIKMTRKFPVRKSNNTSPTKDMLPSNISFSKLPEWPNVYDAYPPAYSKV